MKSKHPIADAIRGFIRRVELDPMLINYERVVYKAALSERGASVDHMIDDETRDSLVMLRATAHAQARAEGVEP